MRNQFYIMLVAFLFIIISLVGCNKGICKQENCSDIVLIFDTVKINYDTLAYPNGGDMIRYAPILTFYSGYKGESLAPIMEIEADTLVIRTLSDYLYISYRYNPISMHRFIAKRGDTIVIDENDITPFLTVLNREAKFYDINYNYYRKARYGSISDYSTEDYYNNPQVLFYMMKGIPWKAEQEIVEKKLIQELHDEDIWLDSIYDYDLISKYEYDIYESKNYYQLSNLELKSKDSLTLKNILNEYNDSIFINDQMGFYSSFYYNCLSTYIDSIYGQFDNLLYDYKKMFDLLDTIDVDLGHLSLHAKLYCLDQIANNDSPMSGQKYYNKIVEQVEDTVLLNDLSKKYLYLFDESINDSNDVELLDQSGKRLNLRELLEKYKGWVVYIDFWASWCQPCLHEMPAAKKLREAYVDKNVVFIYLAINDKEGAWKKAISTMELSDVSDNYLILNTKTSTILKELNIKTIPRYIIYNKQGKMIHKDAPRPSDQRIKQILNQNI